MRGRLDSDPKELAVKEWQFMLKECAKLESIGNLQAGLDEYRKNNNALTAGQKAKDSLASNSSEKLGNHLRAIGQFKLNNNWHAHHVVCS